jgi:hypothetical protein
MANLSGTPEAPEKVKTKKPGLKLQHGENQYSVSRKVGIKKAVDVLIYGSLGQLMHLSEEQALSRVSLAKPKIAKSCAEHKIA